VIDHPAADIIEIRWYDSTVDLDRQLFNAWLSMFAGHVESTRRRGVLVDATSFRMAPKDTDADWRDANIIPRYNSAGVSRFAFHMPKGMPAIGAGPYAKVRPPSQPAISEPARQPWPGCPHDRRASVPPPSSHDARSPVRSFLLNQGD